MPPTDALEIAAEQHHHYQQHHQQQQQQQQQQLPFPPQPSSGNDSEDGPPSPRSFRSATRKAARDKLVGSPVGMHRLRESEKRLRESNTMLQVWSGYRVVGYGVVWCDVVLCGVVVRGTSFDRFIKVSFIKRTVVSVWNGVLCCRVVWDWMEWYGMVLYGMLWYGMVWYGMEWCGMVCGMILYKVVWYGMVWYRVVWRFGVVRCAINRKKHNNQRAINTAEIIQ